MHHRPFEGQYQVLVTCFQKLIPNPCLYVARDVAIDNRKETDDSDTHIF